MRIGFIALLSALLLAVPALAASTLQRGDSGPEVEALQEALGVTVDGEFGTQTARAVRRYKVSQGMNRDAIAGPKVLAALGLSDTEETSSSTTEPTGDYAAAIEAAQSVIGTPHASGGNDPSGFDCSGLTVWAFKQAGVKLPRSSFEQYEEGTEVTGEILPGDLVFFDAAGPGASHVGIAISANRAISATSSKGVAEHPIDSGYWGDHYLGARRL